MATVLQETTASLSADFAECEKCFMCGEVCATDADLDHHVILCAKGRLRKSDSEARSSPPPPQPLTTAPIPMAAMTISTAHDEVSSLPAGSHDVSFVSDVPMVGNSLNTSVEHGTATGGGGSNWGSPKEGGEFESPKSRRRRAHTAHGLDEESIVAERQRRRYVMEEQMLSLESLQQANQERLLRKPPQPQQNSHHDVITTPKVASTSSSSAFTFATASRTSRAVVTGTSLDANHNSPNAYNRRHSSFASMEHHPTTVDHHHGSTGAGASPSHHQGAGTTTYQSLARRSAQATSMERSSSAVVLPTAEGGPAPRTLPMHRDPLRSRLGASASPLPQRPPFRTTIRTTAPVAAATDDSLLPRRSSPTAVRNAVGTTGGPTGSGAARRSSTVVSRRPPSAPEPRHISTAGSPQAPHSSPNATSATATTTTTKTVPSSASGNGLASSVRAGKVPISHKDLLSASTRLATSVGRSVRAPNLQRTAPAAPTAVAAKSTVPTSTTSATRRVVTSTPAADDVAPNRPSTIHLSSGGIVVGPTPQPQHASLRPPTKKYYSTAVLAGSNHATTGTGSSHNNYNPAPSVVSSSSNTRHVPPPPNRQQRVASRSVTEASPSTVVAVDASMAVGGAQFCAECGVKYVAHAKFCAYCGHRREETLLSVAVVESTTNPASASPSSTTLAVDSSPQQLPSSEPDVSE